MAQDRREFADDYLTGVRGARARTTAENGTLLDPADRLYREEAVSAYRQGGSSGVVVRLVRPSTWVVLTCLAVLVASAVALFAFGRMELSAKARGSLHGQEPPVTFSSQLAGTVAVVHVRTGDIVEESSALVTLDSTALRAQLLQAEERLEFATVKLGEVENVDSPLYEDQIDLLAKSLKLSSGRIASAQDSMKDLERSRTSRAQLLREGIITEDVYRTDEEALRTARRNLLAIQQEVAATGVNIRRTKLERQRLIDQWAREREEARRELDALKLSLERTVIRAPLRGRVEGLNAKTGQVLPPGTALGRVVPLVPPTGAIVFVQEQDRAFVKPGAAVWFELDRLPLGEFGALRGEVVAADHRLATTMELEDTLGTHAARATSGYAVHVRLEERSTASLIENLEPGAMVTAHIALRQQRIATLLFTPLRRWLQ